MSQDIDLPNRRSVRLPGFDYARPGWFVVTICTHDRRLLLGEIVNGEMQLNTCGDIVLEAWLETEQVRPNIWLDACVIMPNHLHGIIAITQDGRSADEADRSEFGRPRPHLFSSPSQTLGSIVRGFKATTTARIRRALGQPNAAVWQRSYYESIIRSERHLANVRRYIATNPPRWPDDPEYRP
jgi:REP element-mobilizing transposase RayT